MFGFDSSLVSSRSFMAAASLRERTVGCCSIIESSSLAARRDRDGALNSRNRTQRNRFRQPPVSKYALRPVTPPMLVAMGNFDGFALVLACRGIKRVDL